MTNTLQIIWDCLDIPNKERVNFVTFKIRDESIKCFLHQDLKTGTITISESSNNNLTLQKILKQLPTAENFFIRYVGQEPSPVKARWGEESQKMIVTV